MLWKLPIQLNRIRPITKLNSKHHHSQNINYETEIKGWSEHNQTFNESTVQSTLMIGNKFIE